MVVVTRNDQLSTRDCVRSFTRARVRDERTNERTNDIDDDDDDDDADGTLDGATDDGCALARDARRGVCFWMDLVCEDVLRAVRDGAVASDGGVRDRYGVDVCWVFSERVRHGVVELDAGVAKRRRRGGGAKA